MTTGTGTKAEEPAAEQLSELLFAQSIVIIREFQPGQVVRVIFITPAQAQDLPTIPPDALQIAVAPAGGL